MRVIGEHISILNENYDSFFDVSKIFDAEKFTEESKTTLLQVDNPQTVKMLVTLQDNLNSMNNIRGDILSMINKITEGTKLVRSSFEDLDNKDREQGLTDDEKKKGFEDAVNQLIKVLQEAINDTRKISSLLESVKIKMIELNNSLDGLLAKLDDAQDENSPYMKGALKIFIDTLGGACSEGCFDDTFILFKFIKCAYCLSINSISSIIDEKNRLLDELERNKVYYDGLRIAFSTYQEVAIKLGEKANEEKQGLDYFNDELVNVESTLGARVQLSFIDSLKQKIYDMMDPLDEVCEQLKKHFE